MCVLDELAERQRQVCTMLKLSARDRAQLVVIAFQTGLITAHPGRPRAG